MSAADMIRDILITKMYVEADPNEITDEQHFHRDLGVDSLGFVELRCQVEEQFGITVSDDDFNPDNFMSIETLTAFIERAKAATHAAP